jgi:hypothetical protein
MGGILSMIPSVLAFDASEELALVNQHALAYFVKALGKTVGVFVEDKVAQPAFAPRWVLLAELLHRFEV